MFYKNHFAVILYLSLFRPEARTRHDSARERGTRASQISTQPKTGPAGEDPGEFTEGNSWINLVYCLRVSPGYTNLVRVRGR